MGSIYQQKHERRDPKTGQVVRMPAGPFWIKCYQNGKVYRESSGSEDRQVAVHMLKEKEQAIRDGEDLSASKTTIKTLAELLRDDYKTKKRHSLRDAERTLAQLLTFFGPTMRAAMLTTKQITAYRLRRQGEGLADSSINRELAALRRMYRLGLKHEPALVKRVPNIELVPENNVRTGFFEQEDYEKMRAALPEHARVPFVIGYYTGMRLGEILSLRWSQVDLVRGRIRLEPGTTKNKEGRTIPLLGELGDMLERWRLESMHAFPSCPWVCHYEGERIGSLKKAWGTACRNAGLTGKLFHDLRRTGVRNLVRAGIPQAVAKQISGHKTDDVFNRYDIVSERDLEDAVRKMNLFFGSFSPKDGHTPGIVSESADVTA